MVFVQLELTYLPAMDSATPVVIVLGGFAGTGKTTLSKRLAAEFQLPRLSSDTVGRLITSSKGIKDSHIDVYWLAYDLVFGLCGEFLQHGVSSVLDLNLGWSFQWQPLDALNVRYPQTRIVPILLHCSRDICLERICRRYAEDPTTSEPVEQYVTVPHSVNVWTFLEHLDRPDVYRIDAAQPLETVYANVKHILRQHLPKQNC